MNIETCFTCFERGHSADECKADKADFELVGPAAAFIGARLNYVLPPCNSGRKGGKPISTIKVDQHKEKFWYARIYCTLAAPTLVQYAWALDERGPGDASPEFKARCFRHDAWHYRTCYLDMVKLIPRMEKRLCSQADYRELLFSTVKEAHDWVDQMNIPDQGEIMFGVDHLDYYRKKYGVETNEQLKETLTKLYMPPSLKDWNPDA
jgi:hypothetical protein